jgi:hypothetical protein
VDDGEVTGPGGTAPIRLIGDPVVDRADAFTDEQSDTAELPRPAVVAAALAAEGFDRLIAPPGSGVTGWSARFRGVLAGCGPPLLLVAALCAGPMHLFAGRVSDSVIAAPMLSDLAGGTGLLLLPLMWLSYLALAALPIVLCLAGATGVVVTWAPEGTRPGLRAVLGAVWHRLGPLWAWLAAIGAVLQARALIPVGAAGPRAAVLLSVVGAGRRPVHADGHARLRRAVRAAAGAAAGGPVVLDQPGRFAGGSGTGRCRAGRAAVGCGPGRWPAGRLSRGDRLRVALGGCGVDHLRSGRPRGGAADQRPVASRAGSLIPGPA